MTVYSHSELATFRRCPREHDYRFRSNREPIARSAALSTGSRIHEALAGETPEGLTVVERAMLAGYAARWAVSNLRVVSHNVAWEVELPTGVRMAGELDALGEVDGQTVIVEHKTTSEDIAVGSPYWQRVTNVDAQASTYLIAAEALGLRPRYVLWDVLRKPLLRERRGESEEQFFERLVLDMAERPDWYFARGVVVRLENERDEFVRDVSSTVTLIEVCRATPVPAPRNPDACMRFGRACDFLGVCSGVELLSDDSRFQSRTYRRAKLCAACGARGVHDCLASTQALAAQLLAGLEAYETRVTPLMAEARIRLRKHLPAVLDSGGEFSPPVSPTPSPGGGDSSPESSAGEIWEEGRL